MAKLHATEAHRRIEELESRVAALRSALSDIAEGDVPGVTFADDDLISQFAATALREDERLWFPGRPVV